MAACSASALTRPGGGKRSIWPHAGARSARTSRIRLSRTRRVRAPAKQRSCCVKNVRVAGLPRAERRRKMRALPVRIPELNPEPGGLQALCPQQCSRLLGKRAETRPDLRDIGGVGVKDPFGLDDRAPPLAFHRRDVDPARTVAKPYAAGPQRGRGLPVGEVRDLPDLPDTQKQEARADARTHAGQY